MKKRVIKYSLNWTLKYCKGYTSYWIGAQIDFSKYRMFRCLKGLKAEITVFWLFWTFLGVKNNLIMVTPSQNLKLFFCKNLVLFYLSRTILVENIYLLFITVYKPGKITPLDDMKLLSPLLQAGQYEILLDITHTDNI